MNNPPESGFCQGCGAALGPAPDASAPAPGPAPGPTAGKGLARPLLWAILGVAVIALAAVILMLVLRDDPAPASPAAPAAASQTGDGGAVVWYLDPDARIENPFSDLEEGKYYYDAVLWAYSSGITSGTDDTHFSPDQTCNRAQVVTFLWNAFGKPEPGSAVNPFEDVQPGKYYSDAVLWAVEAGVTRGVDDSRFDPNGSCSRAQVLTFLWNAYGRPAPADAPSPFEDVQPGKYYSDAVLWAAQTGIIRDAENGRFCPNDPCTRAQVVTFLYLTRTLPKP